VTENRRIRCAEIWGGISLVDTDVCTKGLSASILSSACGSNEGGDIYYFSVCSSDLLSRVAIADMRGHGEHASRLSGLLFESLQKRMNTLEGNGVLEELNDEVRTHGFDALTTAAVLSYYISTSKLYFSYAGHPPILLQQGGTPWRNLPVRIESPGANLPLGVRAGTRYDQDEIELRVGDRLFVYTDGIVECPNAMDEEFGEQRLIDVLNTSGRLTLTQTKEAVLKALREHAGGALAHDDCTFLVIEVVAGSNN
jgi:sigma-B regulation protein RsbU (phosphoserine phosphatase)